MSETSIRRCVLGPVLVHACPPHAAQCDRSRSPQSPLQACQPVVTCTLDCWQCANRSAAASQSHLCRNREERVEQLRSSFVLCSAAPSGIPVFRCDGNAQFCHPRARACSNLCSLFTRPLCVVDPSLLRSITLCRSSDLTPTSAVVWRPRRRSACKVWAGRHWWPH